MKIFSRNTFVWFFLGVCLWLFSGFLAEAADFCRKSSPAPTIKMDLGYGEVVYENDLRAKAFERYLRREMEINRKMDRNVRGLTIAAAEVGLKAQAVVSKRGNEYCVELKEATLFFGYKRLVVLIDKRYRPKSCEYDTVKDHEDTHVYLNREVVHDYSSRIYQAAYASARSLKPVLTRRESEIDGILSHMSNKISTDLDPLMKEFEAERERRNMAIDTPESYRQVSAKCRNW